MQVVADETSNSGQYAAVTFPANQGVPVRVNGNYAIFRHAFIVFDGRNVETASFNFSAAASTKEAGNAPLLWNVPELAGRYEQECQRLWDEGRDVKPRYKHRCRRSPTTAALPGNRAARARPARPACNAQ